MKVFASPAEAKQFFVWKVVEQASLEDVQLDELEKKMLEFTETGAGANADLVNAAEEFDERHPMVQFEAKISGLIRRAYERDVEQAGPQGKKDVQQSYRNAFDVLRKEDHYILVMIEQGIGGKLRKKLFGIF